MDQLAYLLNIGHVTSVWTFSKPDSRHFCLTADLAHFGVFILILQSTNVLNNNKLNSRFGTVLAFKLIVC